MPGPVFTNNDSEISRLEGLYIKERNPPATISGVFLGVVGVVGDAIRGPVDRPQEITSEARFREVFGGRDQGSGGPVASSLWKTITNKPFGKLVVTRACAAAATTSTLNMTGSACATGTLQAVTQALTLDGETFVISDGTTSKTFEFDKAGDGVTGGRVAVNITGAVSAVDVANAMISAINGVGYNILASSGVSGLVNLVNKVPGVAGNVTITDTVANAGFTSTGMSGGTASGTLLARVDATSPGAWGQNVTMDVTVASDVVASHQNLAATYLGRKFLYKNLDITPGSDNSLVLIGSDVSNPIVFTKIANGRIANVAGAALAGGSDGTLADSDFTAANRGLNTLASYKGLGVVLVAERSSAALKSYIQTLAPTATDRFFLVSADNETTTITAAQTELASFSRSDRIIYCYNHPYTLDPETATEMISNPTSWMASVLSQIDVDIHPGEEDTKPILAGITRLSQPNLQREDYITLKEAGACALEQDEGFAFVSGVTTSLVPGKEQITRRRMTDYLQGAIAKSLKHVVKKKDTDTRKQASAGMIDSFLETLKGSERIVKAFLVDPDLLNTDVQESQGIVRIYVKVKLIAHILELVLETEIGTAVQVKEAA